MLLFFSFAEGTRNDRSGIRTNKRNSGFEYISAPLDTFHRSIENSSSDNQYLMKVAQETMNPSYFFFPFYLETLAKDLQNCELLAPLKNKT